MEPSGNKARHVAIIMDGNGRWAKRKGLPRAMGHQRGVEAVRRLVRSLEDTGLVDVYAFSWRNWKRPEDEVDDLMNLMRKFIKSIPVRREQVKLHILGDWRGLAPDIVAMLEDALEQTAHGTRTVAVALNYGAQQEIVHAAKAAADEGAITQDAIERHLFSNGLPPLDLLIRTSGEVRLSNFLLWQAAYAEMLFVDTLWPDFTPEHLQAALNDFANRDRRYGGR